MSSYLDTIALELSAQTEAGKIRQQVLANADWSPTPTINVSYNASVRVLIVAPLAIGESIQARLEDKLVCFFAEPGTSSTVVESGRTCMVKTLSLQGYLGKFSATVTDLESADDSSAGDLGVILGIANGLFDHVIDCSDQPLISAAIKPPGYYHVSDNQALLDEAIEQIPELIGEFDKPKFFDYNPDICAHGRSGISGCTRCLDACPTEAIISIGEQIEVNPYLCQGGGNCTSSCPSGAITYLYPNAQEQLEFLRQLTRNLRKASGNHGITMLIYDNEHGAELLRTQPEILAEHVLPMATEEIGSTGLDFIASAMAYGVDNLIILVPTAVTTQVKASLDRDIAFMQEILASLSIEHYRLKRVSSLDQVQQVAVDAPALLEQAATFSGLGNKRSIIRSALAFFKQVSASDKQIIELHEGSIFGSLDFKHDACTLCMGCVSVCPAGALEAGGDTPALKFIEANCLQCGICTRACPETALALKPQFNFDLNSANKSVVIKEEEPFRCISCNKPFATHAMINKVTEKLKGHWMFDKPEAVKRLRMCEDCRVADMFDRGDTLG